MIIEIVTKSGRVMEVHSFPKNHITVGRGYGNDLILQDPYLDADHLDVFQEEDTGVFTVRDLGSKNGTILRDTGQSINSHEPVTVASGQRMTLGKTTLRLLEQFHPVATARQLSAVEPVFTILSAWWITLLGVMACAGITLFNAYVKDPFSDQLMRELRQAIIMIMVAICYSGLWMLIARLQRIEGQFFLHMNMFLIVLVADGCTQLGMPVIGYNFSWLISPLIFAMAVSYALVSIMLFISTRQSTHLPRWASGSIAGVLAFLVIMSDLLKVVFPPEFSAAPAYNMTLVPPDQQWRRPVSETAFMLQIEEAFAEARERLEDD